MIDLRDWKPARRVSVEEMDTAKTAKGGWSRATLAMWGVPWPAPKGWRDRLASYVDDETDKAAETFRLLQALVSAVIDAGRGDILGHVEGLEEYFGAHRLTAAELATETGIAEATITGPSGAVLSYRYISPLKKVRG